MEIKTIRTRAQGGVEYIRTSHTKELNRTYSANMIPQSPVLKTTSIVPQFLPVKTYKSLAKVIPGSILVKKTYTALAKISWLKIVQSETYRRRRLIISCFTSRKGRKGPPVDTEPRRTRKGFGVCLDRVIME